MQCVNMLEAKTTLSKLIKSIESGTEDEILIARHGRPVARLLHLPSSIPGKRIGVASGKFTVPDTIDDDNETIGKMFAGLHS